jgi:O-antigen/teichoic acid export membrane protein
MNGYVYQIAAVVNKMLMASTARTLEADESGALLQGKLEAVGKFQLITMGAIVLLFAALGDRIIDCWLGEGYDGLLTCILVLLIPTVFRMTQSIADSALMLEGYVRERGILGVVLVVSTIVIAIIASPKLGALGAAIGLGAGGVARAFGLQRYSSSLLDISTRRFLRATFGRWWIPFAAISVVGRAASNATPLKGWLALGILALVMLFIYATTCWFVVFNAADRERARGFLK